MESEMWPMSDLIFFVIFGFFVSLTAIFFVVSVLTPKAESAQIKYELESYFLIGRLLKSPNCFAFYDASDSVYTGYLDYSKFNSNQLNKCFGSLNENNIAFRITLRSAELKIPNLPIAIQTANWNDNRPIEKKEQPKRVVIVNQNNKFNGDMSIEIQNLK